MKTPYQIERITRDAPDSYFSQLANLHQQEIGQGFLSSLGADFLQRLYRSLSRSPHAFLIAAVSEGRVFGFICGSTDTKKVYRNFLMTGGLRAVVTLLPKLLSTARLRRVAETLLYPSRHRDLQLPSAEILNFCVDQHCQRLGIGKQLFGELVAEFRDRQVGSIRIVTGAKQGSAQRFYESLSAVQHSELEIHAGDPSLVYTYDIPEAAPLPPQQAA